MATGVEPLIDTGFCDDADLVVAAYGSVGKFVRYACLRLPRRRAPGGAMSAPSRCGPSPRRPYTRRRRGRPRWAVYEQNMGQMVDDVRLATLGAVPVEFIGGPSWDHSGFGIGPDINVPDISERILEAMP